MNELEDGVLLRGNPETFILGGGLSFKLDFLGPARRMAAPEICELILQFSGNVDAASGTAALGRDHCKLLSRFRFTDKGGQVVDCSGEMLRMNEILELGVAQEDPADVPLNTIAARTWDIVIPFELPKSERSRDTTVPLEHFLEGGQVEVVFPGAYPTGFDAFIGTVTLWARVKDGRRRELKSRLVIRDEAVTIQEGYYNLHGSVRALLLSSVLATTGQTSLAAFTSFNSTTLGFPAAVNNSYLRRRYRMQNFAFNANDPVVAAVPTAIAFVTPDRWQKIGNMPDVGQVHVDLLQAPPAGGRMFYSVIRDRNPELAALVAGYANIGDLQGAFQAYGRVVSAKGKNAEATSFRSELVRRLPARIEVS